MKQVFTIVLIAAFALSATAQEKTEVKVGQKNVVTVSEDGKGTKVKVGNDKGIEVVTDDWGDTTKIRIGRRTYKVVDGNNGTQVKVHKEKKRPRHTGHFNAHWSGIEFGVNMFHEPDYSEFNNYEFMDLDHSKSLTVNINFAEWAYKNRSNNFALVTGMGFSFMDFSFNNPITLGRDPNLNRIMPVDIPDAGLKKTKLTVSYLTVPLMLEIKTPLRLNGSRLYIGGGVIGGLHLGSHTKYKYKKEKNKDKGNFYIRDFKYDFTGRIGFGDFCLFANLSANSLFEGQKGPMVTPLTVGISFINF